MSVTADFYVNNPGVRSGHPIRFYDMSSSSGETVVSWSWDFGDSTTSTLQNPEHTFPVSSTSTAYTVALTVTGSTGATSTSTKTNVVYVLSSDYNLNKPNSNLYSRTSVFLYNGTHATIINREGDTNNTFVLMGVTCTGSINRGGTATINIVDVGATAVELALIGSNYQTETNVAIIVGYDVVWSGRILRATQGKLSIYDSASPVKEWTLECESNITKMSKEDVTLTGSANNEVGVIVSSICNSGTDWIVPYKSQISKEGPTLTYVYTNKDKYTQFQTLQKISGFDYRTRLDTKRYTYSSITAGVIQTQTLYRTTTNSLAGFWVVFLDTSLSYPTSYGYITANDATTVTATITGTPAASGDMVVICNPYLDFVSDVSEPGPIHTYTMNYSDSANLFNGYEFDDKSDRKNLITKVVASAKDFDGSTISLAISAKDGWNADYTMFKNSTYITYDMDGYVYSYGASALSIALIGQNYAWAVNDTFYVYGVKSDGTTQVYGPRTVTGVTTQTQTDGTKTTTLSFTPYLDTIALMKYSVLISTKQYVKSYDVNTGGTYTVTTMGAESRRFKNSLAGSSATYGLYITIESTGDIGYGSTTPYPHSSGCLIQNTTYSEASPQTASPISTYGIIQATLVVDTNTTKSALDVYATAYLISNSYYYKRATFWCHPFDFTGVSVPGGCGTADNAPEYNVSKRFLMEGQRISVIASSGDDATEYQIVDWTYDANNGRVDVTLGDFDRNLYTLIGEKTGALTNTLR